MLSNFILNGLDMINMIYLWSILSKKSNSILKLVFCIIATTALTTIANLLELNFIIQDTIIIIVIKLIYKSDLKEIIFEFFLALLINMSMQLILIASIKNLISNDMLGSVIAELMIFLVITLFSKTRFGKNITFKNIDNNIIVYFLLVSCIYALVFKIIWDYDNNIILNNSVITSVILSVLVILQILTYLYVVKLEKEKLKLKVTNEYNAVIDEIVQEIKQRQHDFINYKNTIKGIVNVVDEKDIKEAINNYIKDEDVYGDKINALIYIDNVVIRSLIYRNMCRFKKYNINFQYEIENNVLDGILSYTEISNLLGNLLNNAFEEVVKKECLDKNIEIRIFKENGIAHLIVKNSIVNIDNINLDEMFTRGYSTKGKNKRGYGLYNVQAITNSKKGYVKLNIEHKNIVFDIYFNNSSG